MVFKEQTFHGLEPEMEAEIANRASVEAAVANALAIAGGIDASDVEVTMERDQIVLSGTVGTVGEIDRGRKGRRGGAERSEPDPPWRILPGRHALMVRGLHRIGRSAVARWRAALSYQSAFLGPAFS